jgi:hypothetical protein
VPRDLIPFATPDMSSLAKSLRAQLAGRKVVPSHVEMLNMLARASGHRNFQHLRARRTDERAAASAGSVDGGAVARAGGFFDAEGRLTSWPAKTSVQALCLWALWSRLPSERVMTEGEANAEINALHLFGDHAIIRRTLCQMGLLSRTIDGREYRRVERPPTPEAAALIRRLPRPAPGRRAGASRASVRLA